MIKRPEEIQKMRTANGIVAHALQMVREHIAPGLSTQDIDVMVEDFILANDAVPAFKGYRGFPASTCVSINEEVVHGIPSPDRKLKEGDLVGVDVGVLKHGYYGDAAVTFAVGKINKEAANVLEVGEAALGVALGTVKEGVSLRELAGSIQYFVENRGYSVVRNFVGHGIGSRLHEEPQVPNYVDATFRGDLILRAGMTIAIEPMVNMGTYEVDTLENGWTVVTRDRRMSVHFEHSVAITKKGCEVLSLLES